MLLSAGLGVAMVATTHIGYQGILLLWPEFRSVVESLYFDIRQTSISTVGTAAIVLVVVAAEELVWRGVAFEFLEGWASKPGVVVGSTILYAVPQLTTMRGTSAWIRLGLAAIYLRVSYRVLHHTRCLERRYVLPCATILVAI
jgi:membrane protease YdiL (CAAX protease family)